MAKLVILLLGVALLATASPARAQQAADSAALRSAALDYIEGWYEGDAARMERAVHPELAKRILARGGGGGGARLRNMDAAALVEATRAGGGRRTPVERRRTEVRILDVFGNAASVRVDATDWVDYLHLVKADGRWVIVNVLWEMRQPAP